MESVVQEKTLSSLQRDRLSNFVKEARDHKDGCFYYALISCYNYLYPTKLLPRKFEDNLMREDRKGKGVLVRDVVKEVKRLEPFLKLKVDHIINHSNIAIEKVRHDLSIPDTISIVNSPDGLVTPESGHSTALIFLKSKDKTGGHFMALVENSKFQDNGYVMGGNSEYSEIGDRYVGGFSFVLVKSET